MKKNKEAKFSNDLKFLLFAIGIILVMSFVFAEYYFSPGSFSIDEDTTYFFNITINNTVPGDSGNITQINITIPSTFTFVQNSNGTISNATSHNFTSTSTVLSWSNYTSYLINGSSNNSYFWFNASASTPGTYNITLSISNHTGTNSSNITVVVADITAPVLTWGTSSTPSSSSLTITFSGGEGTCTVDGTGASVTTSTLTATGLNCGGNSYSYTITCTDAAGNSGSTSTQSFSSGSCPSSLPATLTPPFYTNTYVVSGEQFENGYTKEISVKHRAKVKIGSNYHYVGVKELTSTMATIEITSDPVEVSLEVGEDAKIDVTDDGFYDIYVLLNSIINNKADLTIQKIHEEIPEGEGSISTAGEVIGEEEEEEEEAEETNLTWLWIIIGVLVLAGIIGGAVAVKKRKR